MRGLATMNTSNGTANCGPDPDIAGIGVMLSFVLATVLTTLCSIVSTFMDSALLSDASLFTSSFDTWLNACFRECTLSRIRRWRRVLGRVIISFADQQLVTGLALMTAGGMYAESRGLDALRGTHFTFLVWMSALASSSHLASLVVLRTYMKQHPVIAVVRAVAVAIFAIGLLICFTLSNAWMALSTVAFVGSEQMQVVFDTTATAKIIKTLFGCGLVYTFYLAIVHLHPSMVSSCERMLDTIMGYIATTFTRKKELPIYQAQDGRCTSGARTTLGILMKWLMVGSPLLVFLLQILFTIVSLVVVTMLKYLKSGDGTCGLNNASENQWDFGQKLPMLLLLLPFLSAFEYYHERQRDEVSQYWASRNTWASSNLATGVDNEATATNSSSAINVDGRSTNDARQTSRSSTHWHQERGKERSQERGRGRSRRRSEKRQETDEERIEPIGLLLPPPPLLLNRNNRC